MPGVAALGADPDLTAEDAGNRSALHLAAYDGHVEAITLLLENELVRW